MFTFLAIVHIIVSVLLVLFILLQDPKGGSGALGMLGGGSSKSLFGSTGGNQFLVNVTKWLALIFAFTSIYLATLSSQREKSIMDDYIPSAQENQEDLTKTTQKEDPTTPTDATIPADTASTDATIPADTANNVAEDTPEEEKSDPTHKQN